MNIRPGALNAIREHALRDRPRECCGILVGSEDEIVGRIGEGGTARIEVDTGSGDIRIDRS